MIRISNVWYVFLAVLLLYGCEKKDGLLSQVQVDPLIQGGPAVQEVEGEELARAEPINEEQPPGEIANAQPAEVIKVGLTIKYDPPSRDRIVYVDQNVTEFKFFKVSATGIKVLGQLASLETIVFTYVTILADFSFLAEVPHLKRLFIDYNHQNIDWSFIEQLPELEVLHVQSFHQPEISIDMKNNRNLEYIGFMNGRLEAFPALQNIPDSLKYLNLFDNKITSLPADFDDYSHVTVLLFLNPLEVDAATPGNVIMEWATIFDDQKYYPPIYWSSASSFSDLD
jgi:hypothetical protein